MDVTLPNGVVIQGVPDGTSKWAIADKAISRGLAKPEDFGLQGAPNPAEGMSALERGIAGASKTIRGLGRTAGQLLQIGATGDWGPYLRGFQQNAEIDAQDKPLTDTTAGKVGQVAGGVLSAIPAAFVPGANTIAGSGLIGAAYGLMTPAKSPTEALINTGVGGAVSAGTTAAMKGLGAAYRAFRPDRNAAASNLLIEAAGGPEQAAQAAQNIATGGPSIPGYQPTTAELAGNTGLAQLERSIRTTPVVGTKVSDQLGLNRSALINAVEDIATSAGQRADDVGLRADFARPLYEAAGQSRIPADNAQLDKILSRPSAQSAWSRAIQLAQERGEPLIAGRDIPEQIAKSAIVDVSGRPLEMARMPAKDMRTYSGRAIQYLKMAMSDIANTGAKPGSGMGSHEVSAVKSTAAALQNWIADNAPELAKADAMFRWASGPINQSEIAAELQNKLVPALSDYGAQTGLNAASYARALRNGDQLAANVLGRQSATLADVMSPQQMTTLENVGNALAQRANVNQMGRAPGSDTVQNMLSNDFINGARELLPGGGLKGMAVNALLSKVTGPSRKQILSILTDATLNPATAQRLLVQQGVPPSTATQLVAALRFAPAAIAAQEAH